MESRGNSSQNETKYALRPNAAYSNSLCLKSETVVEFS